MVTPKSIIEQLQRRGIPPEISKIIVSYARYPDIHLSMVGVVNNALGKQYRLVVGLNSEIRNRAWSFIIDTIRGSNACFELNYINYGDMSVTSIFTDIISTIPQKRFKREWEKLNRQVYITHSSIIDYDNFYFTWNGMTVTWVYNDDIIQCNNEECHLMFNKYYETQFIGYLCHKYCR
jgi:hypothetical protein